MKVKDARAVVSGGASGLGRATVEMVLESGGRAAIFDLDSSDGSGVAEELGDRCTFFPTDVSDPAQVTANVDGAADRMGGISLLVNCAGVSPAHRVLGREGEMHPLDVFKRAVDINLNGTFDMVRNCARRMAANEPGVDDERGLIVNTSSIAGLEGQVGQAAYAASKGAVAALTLPLARDLAKQGIRVMTIAPGIMDTAMLAGVDEKRRAGMIGLSAFPKRLGKAGEFAELVRAFCETTLLNGDIVRLDAATRLA